MEDPRGFWDTAASGYDMQNLQKYAESYKTTIKEAAMYLKQSDEVLEFGCGTGIVTLALAGSVKSIHATDISVKMLEAAKCKAAAQGIKNVEFQAAAIFDNIFEDQKYDVVFAFNVLGYIREYGKAISRVHSLLKPGGLFLSATDCYGDKFMPGLMTVLNKLGVVPNVNAFRMQGLEKAIGAGGFDIVGKKKVFDSPPNWFFAAKKM